jgi:hypothetical protein
MKTSLLVFIILIMAPSAAFSQDCPYEYYFTTQSLIDNFQTNYPGCTEIQGNVFINGENIANIEGLSVLTHIGGVLYIEDCPDLTSLYGLRNLQSVSGFMNIENCDKITDLTGLNGLDTLVSGGMIYFNDSLQSLNGLNGLKYVGAWFGIYSNYYLRSLEGLDSLNSVESYLHICDNEFLTSLEGLESLQSVNQGSLEILRNDKLETVASLGNLIFIGDELRIEQNPSLQSLQGLEGLDSIQDGLLVSENAMLKDLSGLENLSYLGGSLEIINNDSLTSLEALQNLITVAGDLRVSFNNSLTSLSGLDNVDTTGINIIDINNNTLLSYCSVKSICDYLSVPNIINEISGNATGCASEAEVFEACITDINVISRILPVSVYPNPAGSMVSCHFFVSDQSAISISIIDLQGREITRVEHEPLNTGPQSANLNVSGIVPGIYIVSIISGTNQQYAREKLAVSH